jgi:hypothetical protein
MADNRVRSRTSPRGIRTGLSEYDGLPLSTSFHQCPIITFDLILFVSEGQGARDGVVVKALRYKPAGRGFDCRCCHWSFSVTYSCRSHYGSGVDSASNRNKYQVYFLGVKGGRFVRLTLPQSCAVVMKSGNLNFLEPSGPLQACNGTALPLSEGQAGEDCKPSNKAFPFLITRSTAWEKYCHTVLKGQVHN